MRMLFCKFKNVHCAFVYYIIISVVLSATIENKKSNRSKRTIGLFFESLASFLNVQDVQTTTPVTFTTPAPGHRRKTTPAKVQKWPPLDLEITPWVLQAVPPTSATPSTTPYPATTPVYPQTEEPNIHAQVIIIPLTDPENNLHSQVEIKKEPDAFGKPEDAVSQKYKYSVPSNYQHSNNYQNLPQNYQSYSTNPQTEVYFWRRLVPGTRTSKQFSNHHQQQQPQPQPQPQFNNHVLVPQNQQQHQQQPQLYNHMPLSQNQQQQLQQLLYFLQKQSNNLNYSSNNLPSQNEILQKNEGVLSRHGYFNDLTTDEELSNIGGNDFGRDKQEQYRSFIDIEPKFRYLPSNASRNNHLSQMYLLERNKRLKNISSVVKLTSDKSRFRQNAKNPNNVQNTDVEIVKSVEPTYFNIEINPNRSDESGISEDSEREIEEKLSNSPTFEMVKSYELPNSDLTSGNKDYVFHIDPEENLQKDISKNIQNQNVRLKGNNNYVNDNNKISYQFKNKKVTFIPPSEREKYDVRKKVVGLNSNIFLTPDRIYQDVYESKNKFNSYNENVDFVDNLQVQNFNSGAGNKGANIPFSIDGSNENQNPFANLDNYRVESPPPGRGNTKYQYNDFNQKQNYFGTNNEKLHLTQPAYHYGNGNRNTLVNSNFHRINPEKINPSYNYHYNDADTNKYNNNNGYPTVHKTPQGISEGTIRDNYKDYPLQNPNAQFHIFIPEEQSLQSPEKHDRPQVSQYQYNSPDYYQDYFTGFSENEYGGREGENKFTGADFPRLPDRIHEQIIGQNEVRRHLVSPPSFDLEADTTEHNLTCLETTSAKIKRPCHTQTNVINLIKI